MVKRLALLTLGLLVACGGGSGSGASGPTTASDRAPTVYEVLNDGSPLPPDRLAMIAAYLRRLEADRDGVFAADVASYPDAILSPQAALLAWIVETPDVHLTVTAYLSMMAEGHGADVGPLVTTASMYGMTARLLENPSADPAGTEVQVAGIEYALHWYEQSIRSGAGRNTVLDDLIARRDRGELSAWFEATVTIGGD